MNKIKSIKAREILDSKGNPTVEVDLFTDDGLFRASVPSGVSKGKYEALERVDAVKNVNEIIGPRLIGKDLTEQKQIDNLMIELDGTENKSNLGTNAILAISIAVCRAGAAAKNISLYQYIANLAEIRYPVDIGSLKISPCVLLIEGGLHAGNDLDIQEFMILPDGESFQEKLRIGTEIYHNLKQILAKKYGKIAINVGLEGGFASPLKRTREVLDLIMQAIEKAGFKNSVKVILDAAASYFHKDGLYHFERAEFSRDGLLNFYLDLMKKYPILGLEDPFDQEDVMGWKILNSRIKKQETKFLLIGDDLTVTNKKRIEQGIKENWVNSVVIKPNQIGTVSETIEAAKLAIEAGWEIFVKHRGGETNDDFIADLAVGLGAKYIMAGAPCRGERVAKYNRLLKIEENGQNKL